MGFSYAPAVQVRTGAERATLVRRTYGLVFLSVIVAMLGTAFTIAQPNLLYAVAAHPFITFIASFIPLMMAQRSARVFPRNIVLTELFTFITGVWIAPVLVMAEQSAPGIVSEAAILTFGAFGVLTLYAFVSRRDFSAWGGFLMVGLFVLFISMILNMFFHSAIAGLYMAGMGVLIMSGLLVFDTWRIVRSGAYGQDDYVFAATTIFIDLLNLFLFILALLGGGNRRR
ncbi:MAG TPA: Bax inhibitor-1/YccA family protein [Gemmatimonadaceae bacterium]|nr:Bax inhibitor-1/YccA family protein [Gemmatimonadaceae bacterium]